MTDAQLLRVARAIYGLHIVKFTELELIVARRAIAAVMGSAEAPAASEKPIRV